MDTSVFENVAILANLAKQPIQLADLDVNAREEYKGPKREAPANVLIQDMETTMRRDLISLFSAGQISPASLGLVKDSIKLINKRLVDAAQDRNQSPVVDLDAHGNLIQIRPNVTFSAVLLGRPNECMGYSIWELIHAVAFEENDK